MAEKKEIPLLRLNGTGEATFPMWADLGDDELNLDKDLARILARVIEQWLFEDDNPTLH